MYEYQEHKKDAGSYHILMKGGPFGSFDINGIRDFITQFTKSNTDASFKDLFVYDRIEDYLRQDGFTVCKATLTDIRIRDRAQRLMPSKQDFEIYDEWNRIYQKHETYVNPQSLDDAIYSGGPDFSRKAKALAGAPFGLGHEEVDKVLERVILFLVGSPLRSIAYSRK